MHVRHGRMYWCYVETDATAEGTLHMEEVIVGYICENGIFMIEVCWNAQSFPLLDLNA